MTRCWKNGKKYVKPLILWPQRIKYQFVATSSSLKEEVTFRLIDAIAKKLKRGETIQNVFHYIITKRRLDDTEARLKNDANNETKKE
jgi:hypothetical protein